MRSTFSGLNTVVLGLNAQKMSLDTVGHNIANANTPGYSRQRVNLVTSAPQAVYTGIGKVQIGTGVLTESIVRIRNSFIDQQMWKETSTLGYGQTILDTLGQVEGVFQEPTETGMQTVLDKFWKAWNTLSTNGSDNGARTALRERGVEVVDAIQQANTQLRSMVGDINTVIGIRVDTINQITEEMLSLNKQIVRVEMGGSAHANDLRDRRDYLVDQLSQIINVRVTEDKAGNYTVQSSGLVLVDGYANNKLKAESRKDPDYGYEVVDVKDAATSTVINFTGGELKGLIDSRDKTSADSSGDARDSDISVKAYLNKLSTMSQFLLQEFNAVHRDGYGINNDPNDNTGYNFFGAAGNGAATDYNNSSNYDALFGSGYDSVEHPGVPRAQLWIDALTVNADLFNPADGLSRIAAKTMVGSLDITQGNPSGGKAVIGGNYTGSADTPTYEVRIDGRDPVTGAVTQISYQIKAADGSILDSGTQGADPNQVAEPKQFVLGDGITIRINPDSDNTVGDTYTFTIPKEPQGNAAGDNAINLGNRLKVDVSSLLGGSSLDTFYGSMIGALGVQTQNAERLTENQLTLVNQINNWRQSVSGVNMDEEISDMIRFQKGYSAAARVLTTMDEMLDKLINGTGVVGR
ncbi:MULTISPECIES: flagellar hook-associated protein FlgK [Sporomusa]|uniref:flagellar hook-associated protein FlgK n=1 Tax=Sporomusa TaxID=2375 RepID=UPI00315956C7